MESWPEASRLMTMKWYVVLGASPVIVWEWLVTRVGSSAVDPP